MDGVKGIVLDLLVPNEYIGRETRVGDQLWVTSLVNDDHSVVETEIGLLRSVLERDLMDLLRFTSVKVIDLNLWKTGKETGSPF